MSKQYDVAGTGRRGEEAATIYLGRKGCNVLSRNWRANPGEIDIVAECNPPDGSEGTPVLAFIEVRTRHGRSGLAEESISGTKAGRMVAAAYNYMEAKGIDPETTSWRIDLIAIAVEGDRISSINWIQGAIDE